MLCSKETLLSANDGKYNAFAGLVFTRRKRLIACWRTSAAHGLTVPAHIVGAYSDNMGVSWVNKTFVVNDAIDARDPHLSQIQNGSILLSYMVSGVAPKIMISTDNGDTFTDLYNFATDANYGSGNYHGYGRIIEDNGGTLYFGMYSISGTYAALVIATSHDNGVTWDAPVSVLDETGASKNNTEMALCFLGNLQSMENIRYTYSQDYLGTFLAIVRPNAGDSYFVQSIDKGATWTKKVTATGFSAQGADMLYSEGKLVCAYRQSGCNPTIRVSDDFGYTWSDQITLSNARGGYCQLADIGNGIYGVIYYTDYGLEADADLLNKVADVYFRFIKISDVQQNVARSFKFNRDYSFAAGAYKANAFVIKTDKYSKIRICVKTDAVHAKSVIIKWSLDGVTSLFDQTISDTSSGDNANAYQVVDVVPEYPYILSIGAYNQAAETHVMSLDVHCIP